MSDDYRDGCSRRIGWTLLMLPWALALYARDSYRTRRTLKKVRRG